MFQREQERKNIINKLIAHAKKHESAQIYPLLKSFIPLYYANVPVEDLESRETKDLYGALKSHWDLIYKRAPGEYKRHIFNPKQDKDGWQSSHTVLEFVLDDQPFLVDTISMEINKRSLTNYFLIHLGGIKVKRNKQHQIVDILPISAPDEGYVKEAPIYIEVDRITDAKILEELGESLDRVLSDAIVAVADWPEMQAEVQKALQDIESAKAPLDPEEIEESKAFLRWLLNDNFTFLGFCNYEVVTEDGRKALHSMPKSGLGVLREQNEEKRTHYYDELPSEARELALSKQILYISKTGTISTVHSARYTDYIVVKRFNNKGEVIGERRFLGLYTSAAYYSNSQSIPVVRKKVKEVLAQSGFIEKSHAIKSLQHILETLPRGDLFQATAKELYEFAMGIFYLQERRRIRLFVRKDAYGRFVSCLVYIPRNNVNTELYYQMQDILQRAFKGQDVSFTTLFTDSVLARIHYLIRLNPKQQVQYDVNKIEQELVKVGRSWYDDLHDYCAAYFGEEHANYLMHRYRKTFPPGYRDTFPASAAIDDVKQIERINEENPLEMRLYKPSENKTQLVHFKLFHLNETIPLSDALPILENMGLRVIDEQSFVLPIKHEGRICLNDFYLQYAKDITRDISEDKEIFQETFYKVWRGEAENDGFNQLVFSAKLNWREIIVLRAYAKYLKQIGFTFSQKYIEDALSANANVTRLLVELFAYRFDPKIKDRSEAVADAKVEEIKVALDSVANLDEDRIISMYLNLILATIRTNYYQTTTDGKFKRYLSFKFSPQQIFELPLPKPKYEIFVYAPYMEGVHLRSGDVARGGLRWSDRREDFRTEILGLMKAQQVKNAVIVPSGAKGGFVLKTLPTDSSRDVIMAEGIRCYRDFIRGLLDLTDNMIGDDLIKPPQTVCYDGTDTYLVVAADKGTASFSDVANEISQEYNFWLGDAFASGGSSGYDHKKMGITARGAWESVKQHFQELDLDISRNEFTVVGIGDLAGDVFGNGMLISDKVKLVAAFNHAHIFIDPDPDPRVSYQERIRMFSLPRSTWEDYNAALISKGGGVYKRSLKSIKLSPEARNLFNIKKDSIAPNDLIRAILKSPVDLLWNGGIGTFVKASHESNLDVGDRANDAIRVNANELTCRVVGEGGNLGFTQLARIEYELHGGRINTDFIDNSGGVDCSDHEVNIKILLNGIMAKEEMTLKQRNKLLATMTNDITKLVLHNNYRQARAISIGALQSINYISLYIRFINDKAKQNKLNRHLEFLPEDNVILERKASGKGFTRPEIAVLSAYSKIFLKEEILQSDLPNDPFLTHYLAQAFPELLYKRYPTEMPHHRLSPEIIATQLSNTIITDMGVTFVYQMYDETRASSAEIVRAYVIMSEVFNLREIWAKIESLDNVVSFQVQVEMILEVMRLIRRSVRWFLRNQRPHLDISSTIALFAAPVAQIYKDLSKLFVGAEEESYKNKAHQWEQANVPKEIADQIAASRAMYSTLNIIEAAHEFKADVKLVATVYFLLADMLELDRFREMINDFPVDTRWSVLARSAVKGDLDWQLRALTIGALKTSPKLKDPHALIEAWLTKYQIYVDRWKAMLAELRTNTTIEYAMLAVAMRELLDLAQASLYGGPINHNTK